MRRASEMLEDALSKIEDRRHWLKGKWAGKDRTNFCAVGAIRESVYQGPSHRRREADEIITEYFEMNKNALIHFNDSKNTTHDQLLGLFRKAIRKAKAQEGEVIEMPPVIETEEIERVPELVA